MSFSAYRAWVKRTWLLKKCLHFNSMNKILSNYSIKLSDGAITTVNVG